MRVYSSTITDNTDTSGAGGIHNEAGGEVELKNTILAGNSGGYGVDCNGEIDSLGYNLIGDVANCAFSPTTGDITGRPAWLGELRDNRGWTFTHALWAGSQAINGGIPAGVRTVRATRWLRISGDLRVMGDAISELMSFRAM